MILESRGAGANFTKINFTGEKLLTLTAALSGEMLDSYLHQFFRLMVSELIRETYPPNIMSAYLECMLPNSRVRCWPGMYDHRYELFRHDGNGIIEDPKVQHRAMVVMIVRKFNEYVQYKSCAGSFEREIGDDFRWYTLPLHVDASCRFIGERQHRTSPYRTIAYLFTLS